ncbi:hypothetical protein [Corynebacterium auris]|uniref:dioxygenase family protein n=1 Tax=Corynebacterium auris TaxID=44750 RepID=UPI0025B41C6A|nr:hypothetical protein [Corynebacterium auris]WJY67974.1 Chlorocatechol 1,2-dioxygenase [Corynebacterium auris]
MVNQNSPMAGAAVCAWHCTADGEYSMYSTGLEDETYLRGARVTGGQGSVEFTTVVPGCYDGRWPHIHSHIHFEVFRAVDDTTGANKAVLISQTAVPNEVAKAPHATRFCGSSAANMARVILASDNVFSDG